MSHRRNGKNGNGNGGGHGFNLATVVQVALIPVLSGGIYLFAQWVTQGDTLKRHETAINDTIPKEFKAEQDAREKTRAEFLDKLGKLNDGISALNTNVAVMAEQNKAIAASLARLDQKR